MTENEARTALSHYEEACAERDLLTADYEAARRMPYTAITAATADLLAQITALDATIQPALDTVDAEWIPRLNAVYSVVTATEVTARTAVLALGASVKGAYLQAVYTRGRTSWDSKGLDGYAVAYPEVLRFRSVGEPSVSIRTAE